MYDKALRLKPDSCSGVWNNRGLALISLIRYQEALSSFETALKFQLDFSLAWNNRGFALIFLDRYEEALFSIEKALELNQDYLDAWNNRGFVLCALNLYDESLFSYERALALNPNYFEAWNGRGLTLQELNRYGEAIVNLVKALKLKPNSHVIWSNLGVCLAELNWNKEAVIFYNKALEFKSDYYECWNNRGNALTKLKHFEEAITSYDKALNFKPNYYEAWNGQGIIFCDHFAQYEDALTNFEKALEFNPNNHRAWHNRGIALGHLNRSNNAIISFDKALKLKPDDHEAWHHRGVNLEHIHRFEEAIASIDKALDFQPDYYKAWNNRGLAALSSPAYSQFPALTVGATLSQQNPHLNQRSYPGQIITLEFGLTQVALYSEGWGYLQRALGEAHFEQGKREKQQERNSNLYWQKARHHLELALSILSVEVFPQLRLETLQLMVRVLIAQSESVAAQNYRKAGVELLQSLLNQTPTVFQKQKIEAEFFSFSQIAVDAWIQADEPITALETAERYKNRCLTWILEVWKETVISPSYAVMQTLCTPDTAVVYWHLSPDSLTTFIFSNEDASPQVLEVNRTSQAQQLNTWMKDWNEDYRDYARKKLTETERKNHPWRTKLVRRLDCLQQCLQVETICQKIPDTVQNLILVPHRDLHLLPIHHLFCDYCCTYLPSVQIGLNLCERATENKTYAPLLSVEDPKTEQDRMDYARLESAIIRHLVKNATCISPNDAATETVLNKLKEPFVTFHFTGHGAYDSRNPAASALDLTDGRLTAKTISQLNLSSYQLIVLSSCETALAGNDDIKTEYVGLSSAFLKAGVANVLSTLWPVNQVSSCWFAIYFYQQLFDDQPPVIALRNTQQWLKSVTVASLIQWIGELSRQTDLGYNREAELSQAIDEIREVKGRLETDQLYEHPFYWAAFTLTGRGNL